MYKEFKPPANMKKNSERVDKRRCDVVNTPESAAINWPEM